MCGTINIVISSYFQVCDCIKNCKIIKRLLIIYNLFLFFFFEIAVIPSPVQFCADPAKRNDGDFETTKELLKSNMFDDLKV